MRYWTVSEARESLPRIRELVERIQQAAQTRTSGQGTNGERPPLADAQEAFEELERDDIILRDPHTGLIDFRARGDDGVVYLLCWRLDDDDLTWWHLPEEGFPGRKPLPREPS